MMRKRLLAMAACSLVTLASYAADPILYLNCDEGTGDTAADLSGNGNDGELIGDFEWTPAGDPQFGNAVLFGMNAHAEIPHDDLFHLGTDSSPEMTVMMWARIDGDFGDQQIGLEKGAVWGVGEYSLLPDFENQLLFQAFDLDEGCDDELRGGNVIDGEWHHLAGTFDGEALRVFIDGQMTGELDCPGSLSTNNDPIYIASRGGTVRWTNGAYDEIRIYDVALSEAEIGEAMSEPFVLSVSPNGKAAATWATLKSGGN